MAFVSSCLFPLFSISLSFSFFFFPLCSFCSSVSNYSSKHFPSFCKEPARAALDCFPSLSFVQFSFPRCSFPGPHLVPGQNPSCFESLSLPGQRFLLCLLSVSSLPVFFSITQTIHLAHPICSLSYSAMVQCELSRL